MSADRALLDRVAEAAAWAAGMVAPGGEGLCLPVTAGVCHVLADLGVEDVAAVAGSVVDDAHWWVRVGGLWVDATRGQFFPGPLVAPVGDHDWGGWLAENEFPPGWTEEHVVLEARRAFRFEQTGDVFGLALLDALRLAAREVAA